MERLATLGARSPATGTPEQASSRAAPTVPAVADGGAPAFRRGGHAAEGGGGRGEASGGGAHSSMHALSAGTRTGESPPELMPPVRAGSPNFRRSALSLQGSHSHRGGSKGSRASTGQADSVKSQCMFTSAQGWRGRWRWRSGGATPSPLEGARGCRAQGRARQAMPCSRLSRCMSAILSWYVACVSRSPAKSICEGEEGRRRGTREAGWWA